ncbi:MAG: hypothetical protein J7518_09390 [Nocardioidaceae bacterium]|nr:hypothetical protein [Nocardioidaceae bacterium]
MSTTPGRLVVLVAVVLASLGAGAVVLAAGDDPPARLSVGWDGSEGRPSCAYDASTRSVAVRLLVTGGERHDVVTVTVSAYADENTSDQVGSRTRDVRVDGTGRQRVALTIGVARPPHVDEDGEAACRLAVQD